MCGDVRASGDDACAEGGVGDGAAASFREDAVREDVGVSWGVVKVCGDVRASGEDACAEGGGAGAASLGVGDGAAASFREDALREDVGVSW